MNGKTLQQNYESLGASIRACDADYEKFTTKQVKASAGRVRANLLNIKKLCDVVRKQILEDLNKLPTRTRLPRAEPAAEQKEAPTGSHPENAHNLQPEDAAPNSDS